MEEVHLQDHLAVRRSRARVLQVGQLPRAARIGVGPLQAAAQHESLLRGRLMRMGRGGGDRGREGRIRTSYTDAKSKETTFQKTTWEEKQNCESINLSRTSTGTGTEENLKSLGDPRGAGSSARGTEDENSIAVPKSRGVLVRPK